MRTNTFPIRWNHKHIVPNPLSRLGTGRPKTVLVVGHLGKISARDLITVAAKVRCVYLERDIATEFVVEDHFAEGWRLFSSFFSDGVFDGDWDVVLAQAALGSDGEIGQGVNEIVKSSKAVISCRELWMVPCQSRVAGNSGKSFCSCDTTKNGFCLIGGAPPPRFSLL
jgi:hypothetical protein